MDTFSIGASTEALPVMTVSPSWLRHIHSKFIIFVSGILSITLIVRVIVSPDFNVLIKSKCWDTYTVPGPGSSVPRRTDVRRPLHMLCAVR